jgi:SprB repeat
LSVNTSLSNYTCSPISCYGSCDGSIALTVTGGQVPFSFAWTGEDFISDVQNPDGLCAGTYSVLVTDFNGCEISTSVTINQPDSVTIDVVGFEDLLCTGIETGSITVSADGGCPLYTYQWSHDANLTGPLATNLASGIYTVSVTDQNGCNSTGTATIEINEPITPLTVTVDAISTFPNGFQTSCPDSTDGSIDITISGGSPDYSISWLAVNAATVVSTNEDLSDAACGDYALTVTDSNGCLFTQTINISCVPTIEATFTALPNPCGAPDVASGSITVDSTTGGGGGPYTYDWSGPSCPCIGQNLTSLNSGDYVVTITDAFGCSSEFTVSVGENDAFEATSIVTDNTCNNSCDGAIDITITDNVGGGGGGGGIVFPEGMFIDGTTEINICYTGTHSWVSDMAFHLIGPPGCGSPDIILADAPGNIDPLQQTCNNGNNFSSLCFSTESSDNFNVCTAAVPLTGTYGTYNVTVLPIDWAALNGCDASEPGWSVEVWDCVAGDSGNLTTASISFTGENNQGDNATITYNTPGGFASVIPANSCGTANVSIFNAPGVPGWFASDPNGGGPGGNYTYEWSGPFEGPVPTSEDVSGLCAGTYTVLIADRTRCPNQSIVFRTKRRLY